MRYETFSSFDLPALQVHCVGHSADPAVTCWRSARRKELLLHYVTDGRGWFNGNPVEAGQGFVIRPGALSEYHPAPEDPWTYLWIIIRTDEPEKLLCHFPAHPETGIFDYDYADSIRKLFDRITQKKGQKVGVENLELFLKILKLQHSSRAQETYDYAWFARNYIEAHYQQRISVAALAAEMNLSQAYLYKVFSAAYGVSPKEYLNRFRIAQAKELLREPALNIGQIARAVGYEDALAFSAFFARKTGESPSSYRKKS